jgi:hypothetical protein
LSDSKFTNGYWKYASVGLAFLVQLVAIVWGLSSMAGSIDGLRNNQRGIQTDVRDVRERMIRLETDVEHVRTELTEHRRQTGTDRGGGDGS